MKKTLPDNAILIPDNAQKVFTGQIFDVYQWPQEMFDGTTKTFEMLKRPDTVQVIAIQDDKLVVTVDEQPHRPARLQFPGGRPDPEDGSWLETAQRELREETGKTFKNWRLIAVIQSAPKVEHFLPIFLAQDIANDEAQVLDAEGERIEVRLMDFSDIRSIALSQQDPTLSYVAPLFAQLDSTETLRQLPEFKGQEVDR